MDVSSRRKRGINGQWVAIDGLRAVSARDMETRASGGVTGQAISREEFERLLVARMRRRGF